MPKLGEYIKILKRYAKNPRIADEDFVNALLDPYVNAGNIKNKCGEMFYLEKGRVSKLLKYKADVPGALRKALSIVYIEESTTDNFNDFISDYLDWSRSDEIIKALQESVLSDKNISENQKGIILSQQNNPERLLVKVLLNSFIQSNEAESEKRILWKNGNNSIDIIVGDLFHYGFNNRKKNKNIIVIPVNTTFDTHITRKIEGERFPLVSEQTIHGQWLMRFEHMGNSLDSLDKRIYASIRDNGFEPIGQRVTDMGTKPVYPIGSVAVIDTDNAFYFLVAVSEFDSKNNAQSSEKNIKDAIKSILKIYNEKGQAYDLYIPLIGTGMSRACLSYQKSCELLRDTMVENQELIMGHIHIMVLPKAVNEFVLM